MAKKVIFPLDIHKTYWAAIGEIIARAALMEHQIEQIIWQALALGPKEGRVLTHGMATKPKISIFNGLSLRWIKDKKIKREIKSITEDARKIMQWRHDVAHGLWGFSESNRRKLLLMRMKGTDQRILPNAEHIPSKILKSVAMEIRAIQKRLNRLREAIAVEQLPLHGKPARHTAPQKLPPTQIPIAQMPPL